LALVGIGAAVARQRRNCGIDLIADRGRIEAGLLENRRGDAFRLIEDRGQQVLGMVWVLRSVRALV